MANFNKVLLMGNLTRDVELRYTSGNQAVAKFGLAINRRYSVGEGPSREQREETTFVDCEAWGRQAEVLKQYMSKGRPLFVEGRLKLDQWQDQEGNKRSRLLVVVENFQFMGSRGDGDSGGGSVETYAPRGASHAPASAPAAHEPLGDDDIPF